MKDNQTNRNSYQNEGATDISSQSQSKKKKARIVTACICAAVVVLGAVGAVIGASVHRQNVAAAESQAAASSQQMIEDMKRLLDTEAFYSGIAIEGVEVGGKTMEEAKAAVEEALAEQQESFAVSVTLGDKNWQITNEDVVYQNDLDAVLEQAYQVGRDGEREKRYEAVKALADAPRDFPVTTTADYSPVRERVDAIAAEVRVEPRDASVTGMDVSNGTFSFQEGQNGREADSEALYANVMALVEKGENGSVEVPVSEVAFKVTAAELQKNMQKLGTYSTVSTNTADGTYNMARALGSVNGTSIPAGGIFSFQQVVGNSDKANGYKLAGTIEGNKVVQNYGGGVCQAASTLYGAALRSNMKIVDRSNHSMPSSYVPIGQDATVADNAIDFKFQNVSPYPVYIAAGVSGRTLTVTFYGYQAPDYDSIEVTSRMTKSQSCQSMTKYQRDNSLGATQTKQIQAGYDAKWAVAQRIFYKNGQVVRTENLPNSYYPAIAPIIAYGPGLELKNGVLVPVAGTPTQAPASSQEPSSEPSSVAQPSLTPPPDPSSGSEQE